MAEGRTVLNGVSWPDGTVLPVPGMYLGVQSNDTLQFFEIPPVTLLGDATGTSPGPGQNDIEVTLASTGVTPGSYINAQITVDAKGRILSAINTAPIPSVSSVNVLGLNGITSDGGPITSVGIIRVGLGDITPLSVSTTDINLNGDLDFTGLNRTIFGDFTSAVSNIRTSFKTSSPNSQTVVIARPSGEGKTAGWEVENTSSGLGASGSVLFIGPTACGIQNYARTGGTYLPFYLLNGNEGLPDSPSFAGLVMDVFGNISIGGNRGLSVNATSRFLYLNSMPGTPTGTPMFPIGNTGPMSGKTAITVDVTNDKVYFRSNGLWRNTNTPDYQEFTATAGQTVFNTQIRTLAKTGIKSFLQIFVNGILQQEGSTKEYIVSGETQITFNNGIAVDADVVIYGFA